ncbi:MAG: tetratricopeptide repeat protein, partial [Jaaginema sp. PMC 1079.18]|nr:tetratricopeptide repeat protein [Jaaginema sp. PMC 1079.18]
TQQNQAEVSLYFSSIGKTYYALQDYQQAIHYYQKSLDIKKDSGDRFGEAIVLDNLSKVYSALEDYTQAMQYHQQSLAIKRQIR